MFGKCGKCEKDVMQVAIDLVAGVPPTGKQLKCAVFSCPHCSTVLSVQVDPVALQSELLAALGKR